MKTLSLTQPYATLIAIQAKKIETRSWCAPANIIGQRIAIHASKGLADMTVEYFCHLCKSEPFKSALVAGFQAGLIKGQKEPDHLYPGDLPRGAILCTARVTGCWSTNRLDLIDRLPDAERAFGNYAPDRWMWGLDEVEVLAEPVPASGKLGLWEWQHPGEVEPVNTEGCIYVDSIIKWDIPPAPGAERFFGNGKPSCHMSTSDHSPAGLEALHRFAVKIGLKRAWFQDHPIMPHYDLTPSKRALAVRNGAIAVEGPHIITICGREQFRVQQEGGAA